MKIELSLCVFVALVVLVQGDMLFNQAGLSNKGWYGGSYTQSNYITKTLDDFNVTGTDSWSVTGYWVAGFFSTINPATLPLVKSWTVELWRSGRSDTFTRDVPVDLIFSQSIVPSNGLTAGLANFTFPAVILEPGNYFIGAYPSFNTTKEAIKATPETNLVTWSPYLRNTTVTGVGYNQLACWESEGYILGSLPQNWKPGSSVSGINTEGLFDLIFRVYGTVIDTSAPVLASILITPATVDFASGMPVEITVNVSITDSNSGFGSGYFILSGPNSANINLTVDQSNLIAGNSFSGRYIITHTITKELTLLGNWRVQSFTLLDNIGNLRTLNNAQVGSVGSNGFITTDSSLTTTGSSVTTGPSATSAASTSSGVTTTGPAVTTSTTGQGSSDDPNNVINDKSSDGSNATLSIALGVVGGIIGLALILIAIIFLFIFLRRRSNKSNPPPNNSVPMTTQNQEVGSQYQSVPSLAISRGPSQPNSPGNSKMMLPSNPAPTSYDVIPLPRENNNNNNLDNSFVIDYNELEMEKEIGKGAYGIVFKGRWRGGVVAIKQLQIQGQMTEKELSDFRSEAAVMKNLRPHVNVVQFLGITVAPHPLCIVTEFLDQGSLWDYIRSDAKLDPNIIMNVVKGIAAGMLHLHREGLIHRDLAARNVLLGSGFQVKISDFGLSRVNNNAKQSNQTKSDTGPLKWMSPEAIRNRVYSRASDIWSFGVTVWEIITRQEPYPELDAVQTALEVVHQGKRLEIPSFTPPILSRVMQACFQTDPDSRPDFDTICKHLQNARMDEWTPSAQLPNSNASATTSGGSFYAQPARPAPPTYNAATQHYGQFKN